MMMNKDLTSRRTKEIFMGIIAVLLAAFMILSPVAEAEGFDAASGSTGKFNFTDVPGDSWYAIPVYYCWMYGLVSGTSETTFSPNGTMTRGQFVTILARMDGADMSAVNTSGKFRDVAANAYYAAPVYWAAGAGITGGTSENTFSPNANVTRQQVAAFIHRYLKHKNLTLAPVDNPVVFKDAHKIADYAKEAAEAMRLCGLFAGDDKGNFNPDKNITRAEGAAVFNRLRDAALDAGADMPDGSQTGGEPEHGWFGVKNEKMTMCVGESTTVGELLNDATREYGHIKVTSSDASCLKVGGSGVNNTDKVEALKPGTADLTVTVHVDGGEDFGYRDYSYSLNSRNLYSIRPIRPVSFRMN